MRRFYLFKLLVPRIIAHWTEPIKLSDQPRAIWPSCRAGEIAV